MKSKLLTYFEKRLQIMEHYNLYSPFPVYDTEYVEEIRKYIKEMEEHTKEYDELPVVACRYCKSLYILNDALENDLCGRCGSINETEVFDSIDEYLIAKEEDDI